MTGKGNAAYDKLDREITAKYGHLYQRMDPAAVSREFKPLDECGWQVGPIAKLDGETCVCNRDAGHRMPHECNCGSWFEGCGRSASIGSGE
jgi:hypothetical protein